METPHLDLKIKELEKCIEEVKVDIMSDDDDDSYSARMSLIAEIDEYLDIKERLKEIKGEFEEFNCQKDYFDDTMIGQVIFK